VLTSTVDQQYEDETLVSRHLPRYMYGKCRLPSSIRRWCLAPITSTITTGVAVSSPSQPIAVPTPIAPPGPTNSAHIAIPSSRVIAHSPTAPITLIRAHGLKTTSLGVERHLSGGGLGQVECWIPLELLLGLSLLYSRSSCAIGVLGRCKSQRRIPVRQVRP
jgi:hypothetical protein